MIFRLTRVIAIAVALLPLADAPVLAQLQVAVVRGAVLDVQGQPAAGAQVTIADPLGTVVASTHTDPSGRFQFRDIVPGAYMVYVDFGGTRELARPLVVRGAIPIELLLKTGLAVHEEVVVRGDAGSNTVEDPSTIAGDSVRRSGEPLPGQRIQAALADVRGWSAEDNGLLHVRGVDDGLLYVQDGIPVYERMDRLFGQPLTPAAISSMHVLDGYIPPEFGYKSGAVVVVRSMSGMGGGWSGSLDAGVADIATRHVQAIGAGPIGRSFGVMFSTSTEESSRFLDPVDLANLHNDGRSTQGAAQLTWLKGTRLFTASFQGGRASYDVPNGQEQEEQGQHQRQRTSQILLSGSWQQARSDRTVWQVSAYARHGRSTLLPSAFDTPITASADRTADRHGALWSVNHQRGRHSIKVGGEASWMRLDEQFSFAITDEEEAAEADVSESALEYDLDNPFLFSERQRPWLVSFYAQDAFRASDRLTINFGARLDQSRMLVDAWQLSPRGGIAYLVRRGTTLRASVMRLFQPPQAEYLLLSSSEEARVLSPFTDDEDIGGGTSIPPERQTAVDLSVAQTLPGRWTFEATGWLRRGSDVDDPNVFVGTTIIFPNSVARQYAEGFDAGITMLPRRGWSVALGYAFARVEQFGPVTGGLFLEDEIAEIQDGTRFIPDHDQRHGVFATASYSDARTGLRVSGTFRYRTGTPVGLGDAIEDDLMDRPGSETVDFDSGRVRARAIADLQAEWTPLRRRRANLAVRFWVNNLTNQTYAFNFGNPFSGTHFGSARRIGVSVRVGMKS
jgi:hypothetical protein